jgi:GH35 family endo-1,4-beta-xylanase
MNRNSHNRTVCLVLMFIMACFFMSISAKTSSGTYDYSKRQRDCAVKIVTKSGVPLTYLLVEVKLLQNDFMFGGTIRREGFDTLGETYGDKFLSYFDVGIPENEMKWSNVMKCPQKCAPDFSKADSLVSWLGERDVRVRGNNLFSNENEDQLPQWTRSLATTAFKPAMQDRIDSAMARFKGKVTYWDIIDAISHGANGSLLASSMLETKSGDTTIFKWILSEARKKDSAAAFIMSDNGLIAASDLTPADQFISEVKPLSGLFNMVGATSHFGAAMTKSSYEPKINYLAQQLGKPVVLTDVDFSFDVSQAPDKIEELMRTCFADTNVGGLCMGGWCKRYLSANNLTSSFIDSSGNETPVGQRWRDVRDGWKTYLNGYTDDSGTYKFTGYQGQYRIVMSTVIDTFYLDPGAGTKTVEVVFPQGDTTAVKRTLPAVKTTELIVNGIPIFVKLPAQYNTQLFLTTFSLSGQQMSRSPIHPTGGKNRVTTPASSYCRVFRIETVDRLPLYTGRMTAVR